MDFSCYTDNFAIDSFTFEFLKNGINWGFPSGHAASTVSLGILFILLFWRNKFITFLSILYTFVILIGISCVRWHWVSDFSVAGIILLVFHIGLITCYEVYRKKLIKTKIKNIIYIILYKMVLYFIENNHLKWKQI